MRLAFSALISSPARVLGALLSIHAGLTTVLGAASSGYLPLWSSRTGHITDLVLIYQGGEHRPSWTSDQLAPYVTWKQPQAEQWLFDGFLFIEFKDGRGHDFANGYKGSPARQSEWRWLLEKNFSTNHALRALDRLVAQATSRLGSPPVRRKVVLTLSEPILGQTNWGTLAGKALSFNHPADRIAACEWHVDQALALWRESKIRNLDLAGFYWVAEQASGAQDILPTIARALHSRGLRFYWIPYWKANGASRWKELGFDYAWQQPNHFFHPEKVPDTRLSEATAFARQHGLGLEFEADSRAISNATSFRPRFYSYLNAFTRDGVHSGASVAYYEGGGALLDMAKSADPEVKALYDTLGKWVSSRQSALNRPPER